MSSEFGGEVLDEHGRFLRRLAAALVRDPQRAEDVAQETWLRWFTRPPRDRSRPRQWLATVTRGVAANLRRGEGRRAQIEGSATPPEAHETTPLDSLRQAERIERVAAAVRALETPYREVILARHFRGLSVRELALETGTSEDTLRTRERRALEQLRGELDREFGGREAWALVLLQFREPAPSAPLAHGPGASSVVPAATWLVAGVCVVASGFGLVHWHAQDERVATPTATPGEAQVSASEAPKAESEHPTLTALREPAVPASGANGKPGDFDSNSSGGSSEALTSSMAEVRGRFLLEGGAPAAGATWYVEGSESNEELVRLHGLPEDWSDPTGTTDVDGRFVLRFDPPRAFQFWISVKAPGHAPAVWRPDIAPGQILDLGTVTLALGATVTGRLMDVAGMPVLGERWSVRVQSRGLAAPDGREDPLTFADVDPATGAFRLDDVQPGPNVVEAYGPLSVEIEPVRVSLESGEFLTCDLAYSGPRSSTRILVAPRVRPNPQHRSLDPEHVRLRGDDGHERTAARHPQRTYLVFDDLAPGLYQLEIDDPWFKPWSQAGIAPGTEVIAQLKPCATVLLTARGPSGAVLPAEEVSVALVRPGGTPREIPMHDEDQPFDGRLALLPGDHALRVRSGTLEGELRVTGLGIDETRALEVALAEAPHLAGRLLGPDGAPIPDHEVLLLEPAVVDDSEASPVLPMNASSGDPERWRRQVGIALTAEDGSFRLPLRAVGTYLVQARRAAGASVTSAPLTLAAGETRNDLELVLASGATVRGRVHGPAGIPLAGMNVWIVPRGLQGRFDTFLKTPTVLSDDGTFALEGLPAGELGMLVGLPDVQRSEFGGDSCSTYAMSPIQVDALELAADSTLEREPSIAALVGTIALDVSVNGVPCPWARVRLQQNNQILDGRASSSGHWGPMLAFAGEWTVTISDPAGAWTWSSPNPVSVAAGVQRSECLSIEFVRASLHITDEEGHPRIDQRLHIAHEGARLPFAGGKTDAEGRVELGLAPGTYRISLNPFEGGVTVEWSASGPLVTELQL